MDCYPLPGPGDLEKDRGHRLHLGGDQPASGDAIHTPGALEHSAKIWPWVLADCHRGPAVVRAAFKANPLCRALLSTGTNRIIRPLTFVVRALCRVNLSLRRDAFELLHRPRPLQSAGVTNDQSDDGPRALPLGSRVPPHWS